MRWSARNGASASGVPSVLALSTTSTSHGLPLASSQPRTAVSVAGSASSSLYAGITTDIHGSMGEPYPRGLLCA